ncbi:hypothetical protein R6Q59_007043 [Mikania micrantha]
MGLIKESPFYEDIVMNPCGNEVWHRALIFFGFEEDREIQRRILRSTRVNMANGNGKHPSTNHKSQCHTMP